ncbi:hypothetical protein EJB05_29774 [Eragrostis curvula]|uniref:FLZ-type domain-containing protein n=1 Tax=Eragrostis curvula TaxID=38414 RepID=A0A5J9UV43_9POAL|nr:hypothetical protein EJB05_29774 [Eragrostis curvula]
MMISSPSTSHKRGQIAEKSNKDETHCHIETGICAHSQPSANMRMQPLCFLQYCGSCNRALGSDSDIYIYKGECAFCSMECREEVMRTDHAWSDN